MPLLFRTKASHHLPIHILTLIIFKATKNKTPMSCISSCFHCCHNNTTPPPNPKTTKHKSKCLKAFYKYLISTIKIIATAILIGTILWLLIRLPEPAVYLTGMKLEAFEPDFKNPNSTLLHYNLTIRNGDLYKPIHYDVLVLMFFHSAYPSNHVITINFNENNGEPLYQRPGKTTVLPNNTIDFNNIWNNTYDNCIEQLKNQRYTINLWFVMEMKCGMFNWYFRRQTMRVARVYFDSNGTAFINRRRGLKLK